MKIQLEPVTIKTKPAFIQLIYLYNFNYDFSNFTNDDIPENGFFAADADYFMKNKKAHNYLIKVDEKIAGYVIVLDDAQYIKEKNCHSIDQFFITRKYRRKGIGKFVAKRILDEQNGKWEICQNPKNQIAQKFWKSVISQLTQNNYQFCGDEKDGLIGFIFDYNKKPNKK